MVFVSELSLPPVDRREAMGYMGVSRASEDDERLLSRAEAELLPELTPRLCYTERGVTVDGDLVTVGDIKWHSSGLARRLAGATRVVIFVATVGVAVDRLVGKYSRLSPSVAFAVSALGSERVEALCDEFCNRLATEKGESVKVYRRFSPGYGDLSLEVQRDIFALLSPERAIGVTLGDGLLMSPTKSVSAIIGISEKGEEK